MISIHRFLIKQFGILFGLLPLAFPIQASPPKFQSVNVSPTLVNLYDRVIVTFTLDKTYSNPYDPDIVDASVVFTVGEGFTRSIPAFWNAAPGITPRWEARLCADYPNRTSLRVVVRDADGRAESDEKEFYTGLTGGKGFIRKDTRNPKYLRFDRGEPYLPVGHNTCWGNLTDYTNWFANMKSAGENWARLWINSYVGRGLEWMDGVDDYKGIGRYSQRNADHFDKVFDRAAANGIYIQLAMDSFNSWNYNTYSDWGGNPYNTDKGGWLDTPDQYFTDPDAFKWALKKHRYIVARWAYSTNVLCWEFFNEVDGTYRFRNQRPAVLDWHQRQARHIRKIDPYRHFITTSFTNDGSTDVYFPEFWQAPELELVQTHRYSDDLPASHVALIKNAQRFGKPEIHGEFGKTDVPSKPEGRFSTAILDSDPTGQRLHDMIWAAAVCESGAMSWWWDNWIHPRRLYSVFTPLTRFLANHDMADKGLVQTGIRVVNNPEVIAYGARGPRHAWLWMDSLTDSNVLDLQVELSGVRNETFYVDYYNTYQFALIETDLVQASGGKVILDFPVFSKDVAAWMRPGAPEPTATPTLTPTPWATYTPTMSPTITPSPTPSSTSTPRPGDFTLDGLVDALDLFLFVEHWYEEVTGPYRPENLVPDNRIDEMDLLQFIGIYEAENETDY